MDWTGLYLVLCYFGVAWDWIVNIIKNENIILYLFYQLFN